MEPKREGFGKPEHSLNVDFYQSKCIVRVSREIEPWDRDRRK